MTRSRSTTIVGSLIAAVVAVSAVAYILTVDRPALAQTKAGAGADATPSGRAASEQPSRPVAVETATPDRRTLVRELALPASLEAYESADLYAKTSGYIAEVKVDIGSRVRAGDLLVRINVPEMADELRQAEATLAAKGANLEALKAKAARAALMVETAAAEEVAREAEAELHKITATRKEELFNGRAIPQQEYDEARIKLSIAKAQVNVAKAKRAGAAGDQRAAEADANVAESEVAVAEAAIARLKTLMEYASITAPFDGVITKRQTDPGDFVRSAAQGATMPLFVLANIDRLRIVLDVPESDCRFVKDGTPLEVRLAAHDAKPLALTVSRSAHALNPSTRTMRAEADLPNADYALAPGMFAHVSIKLETKQAALLVPSKAVRVHGRDVFVLVADGGVARSVPVQVGYDDGEWTEIVSGLSGAEYVITAARGVLAAGMPVAVAEQKTARVGTSEAPGL
jgi:RND family efflux transporter MFP subunit